MGKTYSRRKAFTKKKNVIRNNLPKRYFKGTPAHKLISAAKASPDASDQE